MQTSYNQYEPDCTQSKPDVIIKSSSNLQCLEQIKKEITMSSLLIMIYTCNNNVYKENK